jgi:uncharacterized protein YndB with AHSA1/START domain
MASTAHLYEIFIRAPRQRVWDALMDPANTVRYFHGTRFDSTWQPGTPYLCVIADGERQAVDGVIEECDPPNRLVMTWHVRYDPEMEAEPASRVEWKLIDANADGSATRLTLRHGDLALSPKTWRHVKLGWVAILDSFKSLVETGEPLPPVDDDADVGEDVDGEWHRQQAITANNSVWELLDDRHHTPEEADELLSRAYAAAYHWARAARRQPINAARAAYMVGKAHVVLGQADMALHHADRYDALLAAAGETAADFDVAYGHELRARALAAAGRLSEAAEAREAAVAVPIAEDEDRKIVEGDLAVGPWFGLRAD